MFTKESLAIIRKRIILILSMVVIGIAFTMISATSSHASGGNSFINAQKISAPGSVSGKQSGGALKYDFYKISTPKYGGTTFKIKVTATGYKPSIHDISYDLYDKNLNEVSPSNVNDVPEYISAGEWKTAKYTLKRNSTYYIKLHAPWGIDVPYSIKVWYSFKAPSTVAIKSARAKKKAVKLTWKKATYATKYQVQIKTKKGKWKKKNIINVKGTKCVVKKINRKTLKKKTSFKVRVRAVRIVSGNTLYGKWSNVKNVRTK